MFKCWLFMGKTWITVSWRVIFMYVVFNWIEIICLLNTELRKGDRNRIKKNICISYLFHLVQMAIYSQQGSHKTCLKEVFWNKYHDKAKHQESYTVIYKEP